MKEAAEINRRFFGRAASVVQLVRHIRVLIVDDHGLMIEAVRLALDRENDIQIVGEARRGADVLPEVARRQPDVVLLDIRMPNIDGLEVLDRLHAAYPEIKVVMLSAIEDPQIAREAFRRGAVAYLDKTTDPRTLATTLRRVAAGAKVRHDVAAPSAAEPPGVRLTKREREILVHVANGWTNSRIAQDLFVSEQTVKYHLTNVYRKLSVDGRAGAIRFWFEHGVLDGAVDAPRFRSTP